MTAKQYRKGEVAVHYAIGDCSPGRCLVAESERGFARYCWATTIPNWQKNLRRCFQTRSMPAGRCLCPAYQPVIASIDNHAVPLALPLDIRGTAFQQRVWQALRDIPAGNGQLSAGGEGDWPAQRGACRRGCLCGKQAGDCDPLSPRGPQRRRAVGLSLGAARKALLLKREAKRREG